MSDFITRNKPDWEELEKLVARARKRIRGMTSEELSRLDVLYRRTTVHLAQVTTRAPQANLVKYLNDLTGAAHSIIYLPPRQRALAGALRFVTEGFARSVARSWKFHLASALLFFAGALVAYLCAMHDVAVAYALMSANDPRSPGATPDQLREFLVMGRDYGSGEKFAFASQLFVNNLKVGVLSLTLGPLIGVPTIFLIFFNGLNLGAFTAMHHKAGIYADYWAWILPHGVTEIGALILCGGVGLMLGWAVLSPGQLTRIESLQRAGREAAAVTLGAAVMLIAAALIESYLRQSYLSNEKRFLFAGGSAIFWVIYLAHGALRERMERAKNASENRPTQEESPVLPGAQAKLRQSPAVLR